jgi:hypothetical protein
MTGMLEQIVASGMAEGEFHPGTRRSRHALSTRLHRFCHPPLMAEYEQEPEPALDQMVDFCHAALMPHPIPPSDRGERHR